MSQTQRAGSVTARPGSEPLRGACAAQALHRGIPVTAADVEDDDAHGGMREGSVARGD
jgi:hypothetical protein